MSGITERDGQQCDPVDVFLSTGASDSIKVGMLVSGITERDGQPCDPVDVFLTTGASDSIKVGMLFRYY